MFKSALAQAHQLATDSLKAGDRVTHEKAKKAAQALFFLTTHLEEESDKLKEGYDDGFSAGHDGLEMEVAEALGERGDNVDLTVVEHVRALVRELAFEKKERARADDDHDGAPEHCYDNADEFTGVRSL